MRLEVQYGLSDTQLVVECGQDDRKIGRRGGLELYPNIISSSWGQEDEIESGQRKAKDDWQPAPP
jgi:hypothetical protein